MLKYKIPQIVTLTRFNFRGAYETRTHHLDTASVAL